MGVLATWIIITELPNINMKHVYKEGTNTVKVS